MLRDLSRSWAISLVLILLAAVAAILILPPLPEAVRPPSDYSDIALYRDITTRVTNGEGYYDAATELQRQQGYPTRPFVTVRQPTLAVLVSQIGWQRARLLLAGLFLAGLLAWLGRLRDASLFERAGAALASIAAALVLIEPDFAVFHETWAGALAFLCLALAPTRLWMLAIAIALAAVSVRELSLPLAVILAFASLLSGPRRHAWAWFGVLAVFAIGMAFHGLAVDAHSLPSDRVSPGWSGFRGPLAPLTDLTKGSLLGLFPLKAGMILGLGALLGLAAMPARGAWQVLAYCLSIALMVTCFARPVNVYWFQLAQPAWFLGLAFIPRALRDLVAASIGHPVPAPA
jgi:hypothetical protein